MGPPVYAAAPAASTSIVTGVDMNRDGIPDVLQGGGYGYGMGGYSYAAPAMSYAAAAPVTSMMAAPVTSMMAYPQPAAAAHTSHTKIVTKLAPAPTAPVAVQKKKKGFC